MANFEVLDGGRDRIAPITPKEYDGGKGGPPMDSFETRVAVLEKTTEHIEKDLSEIKTDIRVLLGALIGGFLILAGLMAHGFKWF